MHIKCTYHHSYYPSPSQCFVVYSGMLNKGKARQQKYLEINLKEDLVLLQARTCTAD